MANADTIKLLQECDAGTKMAISAIDEVIDRIFDFQMKCLLRESRESHMKLQDEIHRQLGRCDQSEKEPNLMAKSMSWMKTNMKMSLDNSDSMAADLITDGCNMGIKSLNRYLNQYPEADHVSQGICVRLISAEEKLAKDLRKYL